MRDQILVYSSQFAATTSAILSAALPLHPWKIRRIPSAGTSYTLLLPRGLSGVRKLCGALRHQALSTWASILVFLHSFHSLSVWACLYWPELFFAFLIDLCLRTWPWKDLDYHRVCQPVPNQSLEHISSLLDRACRLFQQRVSMMHNRNLLGLVDNRQRKGEHCRNAFISKTNQLHLWPPWQLPCLARPSLPSSVWLFSCWVLYSRSLLSHVHDCASFLSWVQIGRAMCLAVSHHYMHPCHAPSRHSATQWAIPCFI